MARKKSNKRNIVREFADYFGNESNLANWQMLCSDLDIEGDLSSITKCKDVRASHELISKFHFVRNGTLLIIALNRR
jgi:hypothetical protein